MKKAKVEIEIIQTDSGIIRIRFSDGGSYPIKDTMENIGIISAFEVELEYAIKRGDEQK